MDMQSQNLWAPWRMAYIKQLDAKDEPGTPGRCFLCDAANADADRARLLVLHNDDRGVILLNRYPYTNGHLLIAPRAHVGDLTDMTAPARAGLMELTVLAERLLRAAMNPQGLNIGINLGRSAGAGVPGHLHVHVVPRWAGDTNFMQAVGQVRVVPQALDDSYEWLTQTLKQVREGGE